MAKITFEELCENVSVDMLKDMVSECNGWNGSLDDYYMYSFDEEFFEMFFSGNIIEAVRATFFGDIDSWTDEYIHFNAYGNLESMSGYQYDDMLERNKEEIIETALELYQENHIHFYNDEIAELFDEYLKDEEEADYDGMVINCPDCGEEITIEFGEARCEACGWFCGDGELDDLMEE